MSDGGPERTDPGTAPGADELRDTVDHLAVNRLHARYADVVTRRAWDELAGLFLPDCVVHIDTVTRAPFELTGPAEVGAFIGGAVDRFDFFEFVVLNSLVDLGVGGDPDAASARLFMCEQRRNAADQEWSTAYGLYRDDVRRVDGSWWFAGRSYRSLARTGPDGAAFPFPDLGEGTAP
jgi:hypothetical protein